MWSKAIFPIFIDFHFKYCEVYSPFSVIRDELNVFSLFCFTRNEDKFETAVLWSYFGYYQLSHVKELIPHWNQYIVAAFKICYYNWFATFFNVVTLSFIFLLH